MTVDVSGDLAEAEQVRVEQGKEGKHFLTVFEKLGFHVRRGKRQSASASSCTLYRVLDRPVPYAVEVPCSSEQMNSLTSFVARASDGILVWHGKGASSEIQQAASKFASQQDGRVVELKEGSESSEWWGALGDKKEYFRVHDAQDCHAVRMFSVSSASGVLAVEEVYDYTQEDLNDGHIAIVDTFVAIYVWIGSKAPTSERKAVVAIVQDYVKQSPRGHDRNVPVWTVEAFHEPMEFKSQFACWSTSRFPRAKRGLKEEKHPFEELVDMFTERTYTFAELKREPLPRGVDPTKLEVYLSDSEFEEVFAMDRAAFKKLPMWKVEKLKQEVGLF